MRMNARAGLLLAFAAVSLADCRLVDQTSFGGAPRAPAPAALAAALASHGAAPLLVIRPDEDAPYTDALRQVIEAATARSPNAMFHVDAVIPAQGDATAQQAGLDAIAASARTVLDDMGEDGITPDKITLSASTEANLAHREIRLFQD